MKAGGDIPLLMPRHCNDGGRGKQCMSPVTWWASNVLELSIVCYVVIVHVLLLHMSLASWTVAFAKPHNTKSHFHLDASVDALPIRDHAYAWMTFTTRFLIMLNFAYRASTL